MRPTAFIVFSLAALIAAGARGAQTPAMKTHRKAASASGSHATRRAAVSPGAHYKTLAPSRTSAVHKPTPDEVGRTAGLAIRNHVALSQAAQRHVAIRPAHARTIRASAPVRRSRFVADDYAPNPQDSDLDSASVVSPAVETNDRARAKDVATESAALTAVPRAQAAAMTQVPAPAAAPGRSAARQPQRADDLDDHSSVPAWRADQGEAAPEGEAVSASNGIDEDENAAEQRSNPQQTSRVAGMATRSDEASLAIPRDLVPAPLRGSLASLERQNDRLEEEGLERIQDEKDLAARIADKLLVPLPVSAELVVNAGLEENHRYCRPWTARFLTDLARAHEAAFHHPIQVNSAVRTVEYQKRLMYTNGNAAAAEGDVVSPHLTGSTIDIAKSGLTLKELAWMRQRLAALEAAGKIDVEEEFRQACFHITVYKSYVPPRPGVPAQPGKPGIRSHPAEADSVDAAHGA
jgi:hypothetical protein